MRLFKKISDIKQALKNHKSKVIGFVPTMGNLHEGHLSLVRRSKAECDVTCVSIYVNPKQFGPNEDLNNYPRTLEEDLKWLEDIKTDFVFVPSDEIMYPDIYSTYVIEENLSRCLCGKSRPTHFRGVTTIVLKLFNIVKPNRAYLGQKDYQQYLIIKRMVDDLNLDIEIIPCPIIREKDGLAMSSRNNYLTRHNREIAPNLYKTLRHIESLFKNGERDSKKLIAAGKEKLSDFSDFKLDYLEIRDSLNLESVEIIKKPSLVAIAAYLGKTRLIDNLIL